MNRAAGGTRWRRLRRPARARVRRPGDFAPAAASLARPPSEPPCPRPARDRPGKPNPSASSPTRSPATPAEPALQPGRCECRVGGISRLDVVPGDAEQEQDRVEMGNAHRGVRRAPHGWLGVERDAEAGRGDHVQVVGTVADGDRLAEPDPGLRRELAQHPLFAGPVDRLPGDPAGKLAAGDLQRVRGRVVEAELGRQPVRDRREAAADHAAAVTQPLERPDQRARSRGQPQLLGRPPRRRSRPGPRAARPAAAARWRSDSLLIAAAVSADTSAA